ncbi:PQQ-binding-like beta-propeller repeat protein [Gaoshiqia sediminis]|uniref:PQQ-like beta-propeller repeat protein n=1 Tax=Gaoshiqia sediminis TaxID=2986998 RepID=A0AA42C5J1_9BACT|nr:PQQ-binding-like beta-propeller repeat protein [Gaoshiqia sediminis]MCW0482898.1 PQQ-like beta-propeller repeat protein [Gaoshiqia sediminis]
MKQALFFIVLCFLPAVLWAQAHKWHGTNQDARYPDVNLQDNWPTSGLEIKQSYTGIGEGYGSPSVSEEGLFIAGMHDSTGYIYHFTHEGELVWKTSYGRDFTFRFPGSRGTPTLNEGNLYYSGAHGDAVCLDMKTGKKIWHVNIFEKYSGELIKWGYTESPLVYRDLVILQPGGPKVSLCALSKHDGSVVWETALEGNANAYCSPKLIEHNGDTLVMVNLDFNLVIFDPNTGNVRIKHPLTEKRGNHSNEPFYKEGQIFYSSGYGEGSVMFQINDEKQRLDTLWQNTNFDSKLSGIQVVDELIYGTADQKKHWAAVRWDTGEEVFTTREIKPGSFVMADGKFFIFTEDAKVVLAKPTSTGFDIISRFQSPAHPAVHAYAHPVIWQGDLFVRFNDHIWRYRISK